MVENRWDWCLVPELVEVEYAFFDLVDEVALLLAKLGDIPFWQLLFYLFRIGEIDNRLDELPQLVVLLDSIGVVILDCDIEPAAPV